MGKPRKKQTLHKEIGLLSYREKMVLLHRTAGQSKAQCSDKLGCTPHTIGDHNKSTHKKLKANSGMMALGMAVATDQITREELIFLFTTLGLL